MIRILRPQGSTECVVPLTDDGSTSLLPMLHVVAASVGFRRVEVIRDGQGAVVLPRRRAPLSAVELISASIASQAAVHRARRELAELKGRRRVEATLGADQRVVYVSANLWFGLKAGGSIGHTAGVINALVQMGYDVSMASIAPPEQLADSVHRVELGTPRTLGLPFETNGYRFGRMATGQLLPLVQATRPQFIYQRLSTGNYSGVSLSRATNTPLVLEYNGSEAWIAMNWGRPLRHHDVAVAAEDASLRHAHLVVTVSDVLRDELLGRGVSRERIVSYPNCIDPSIFDPARFSRDDQLRLWDQHNIPRDAIIVTFVGTFGQWHGVDVLAEAVLRLVQNDAEWLSAKKIRFLFVGDGLKAPAVDEILKRDQRCADFVIRTGLVPQHEAPAYLAISDVVVSPHVANADGSRFFGSPTKLFEYMAMGKAIVASELDQIGEVLKPGLAVSDLPSGEPSAEAAELAVLAEPGSVDDLVTGIRFLADHPGWRCRLGANARRQALEHYTWDRHVAAILERLRDVVPPDR